MAHYSSQLLYYEDGDKLPLKSISVKLLVIALYAQFRVVAERKKDNGRSQWHVTNDPLAIGDLSLL